MKRWILVTSPKKVMALEESRLSATEAEQTFLWWDHSGFKWGLKYARVEQCGREFDEDGARWTDFVNCSPTRPRSGERLLQKRCGRAPKNTNWKRNLPEEAGNSRDASKKVKISEDSSAVKIDEGLCAGDYWKWDSGRGSTAAENTPCWEETER